jgi:long-subunit acyl-CoA synthetase (AMP-forming)
VEAAAILTGQPDKLAKALVGRKLLSVDELFRDAGESAPVSGPGPEDLALLAFTSGSTQDPRAVCLTHANLMANVKAVIEVRQAAPGDAFLSMLPPTHLFELVVGQLCPLACGAQIVYASVLLPNRLIDALGSARITHALVVPALLDLLYREVVDLLIAASAIEPSERSLKEITQRLRDELSDADLDRLRAALRERLSDRFRTIRAKAMPVRSAQSGDRSQALRSVLTSTVRSWSGAPLSCRGISTTPKQHRKRSRKVGCAPETGVVSTPRVSSSSAGG